MYVCMYVCIDIMNVITFIIIITMATQKHIETYNTWLADFVRWILPSIYFIVGYIYPENVGLCFASSIWSRYLYKEVHKLMYGVGVGVYFT